jgi:hypothetical protein
VTRLIRLFSYFRLGSTLSSYIYLGPPFRWDPLISYQGPNPSRLTVWRVFSGPECTQELQVILSLLSFHPFWSKLQTDLSAFWGPVWNKATQPQTAAFWEETDGNSWLEGSCGYAAVIRKNLNLTEFIWAKNNSWNGQPSETAVAQNAPWSSVGCEHKAIDSSWVLTLLGG